MTPRQAEVAFVLESVSGVRGVYAVESGHAATAYDFAVEIDDDGRALAALAAALLRVLTHRDCERVAIFRTGLPPVFLPHVRPLRLDAQERAAARNRVPEPAPWAMGPTGPRGLTVEILLIDDDEAVLQALSEVFENSVRVTICTQPMEAAKLARMRTFDVILCDAGRALGPKGFLTWATYADAELVVILATPKQLKDDWWKLQSVPRILQKPLLRRRLRERILGLETASTQVEAALAKSPPRRSVVAADRDAPLRILFVDLDDESVKSFVAPFGAAACDYQVVTGDDALETVFEQRFHLVVCSAGAALRSDGFVSRLARQDAPAADRVLVLVPLLDAAFVHEALMRSSRGCNVLALPLEEGNVLQAVARAYPAISTHVAIDDIVQSAVTVPRISYRRLAVLVVDDDTTTQILFAASAAADSDITLATSSFAAFEHCMARPIDVLVVSASLRGEGGEPLYRVLWRMKPELKSRTVLIVAADAMPPSAPASTRPRILERPVSRDAVARLAAAFRDW